MPAWNNLPLVLASASPRRRVLLEEYGYTFEVAPSSVEEHTPPYLTPAETVLYNARAKADAIAAQFDDALVLGVDTEVAFEGEIFGKPRDMDHAVQMLTRLNGESHYVYSGVWLAHRAGNSRRGFIESTRVQFRKLSLKEIRKYLERIGPLDKAGAYSAQDDCGELIASVEGSYSNVVGLPMETLNRELKRYTPPRLAPVL